MQYLKQSSLPTSLHCYAVQGILCNNTTINIELTEESIIYMTEAIVCMTEYYIHT